MRYCAFKSCKNSTKNGQKLYHFPKDLSRRKIWLKNSGLEAVPTEYSTLCDVSIFFYISTLLYGIVVTFCIKYLMKILHILGALCRR